MSCWVAVHNIDHKATDEEIINFMELVGPLKCVPKESNKKQAKITRDSSIKVYGNFEYVDQQSALSAYRNLNKRLFNERELQVKYIEHQGKNQNNQRQIYDRQKNIEEKFEKVSSMLELLEVLPKSQKIMLMVEMKNLVTADPSFVEAFLQQNPQFTQMILELQTELNINSHNTVNMQPDIQRPNIIQNSIFQDQKDKQQFPPCPGPFNNNKPQPLINQNNNQQQQPLQQFPQFQYSKPDSQNYYNLQQNNLPPPPQQQYNYQNINQKY